MAELKYYSERTNKHSQFVYGALSGISAVALLELMSIVTLDVPLTIACYAFALTLPTSIMRLFIAFLDAQSSRTVVWKYSGTSLLPVFGFIVGFTAICGHFSLIMAGLFIASTILALFLLISYLNEIEQPIDPPTAQQSA